MNGGRFGLSWFTFNATIIVNSYNVMYIENVLESTLKWEDVLLKDAELKVDDINALLYSF